MSDEIEQLVEVSVVLRITPQERDAILNEANLWQASFDEIVSSVVHAKFTDKMPHENDAELLARKGIPISIGRGVLPEDDGS